MKLALKNGLLYVPIKLLYRSSVVPHWLNLSKCEEGKGGLAAILASACG